jgi:hypothetical protein
MLANRADTYNLGDIIGGSAEWFKASYLENSVTSNAVLAPLANRSQKDIRAFVRMASGGGRDDAGFEGSYSSQEVEEILSVMKKLVAIREVVLRVNLEYIHSAAQADEFRTEPPFRLQGSYRNMNRLAERVVSIMNDDEVRALIADHYRSESQTLTTGAESNFLKFKEMIGAQTPEEKARWEEIKRTFKRNQVTRGVDGTDSMGRVVAQLASFSQGMEGIQQALEKQSASAPPPVVVDVSPLAKSFEAFQKALQEKAGNGHAAEPRMHNIEHEIEMLHSTLATLKDLAAQQRDHLRRAQELLEERARKGIVEIELTQEMLTNERAFLEKFHQVLAEKESPPPPPPTSENPDTKTP